jgi:hypothetical protein
MLASILALTLVATPIDAHRALQAEHIRARTAASELYNYASNRVHPEPQLARKITADIGRAVEAGAGRFTALRDGLGPTHRGDAATELQFMADWHDKAAAAVQDLKNEVAKRQPNGREVRFHTSAIYGALASAAEGHQRLMERLDVRVAGGEAAPPGE